MPTIDVRGQTVSTTKKTVEQKAVEAADRERSRREKIVRNHTIQQFAKEENDRIKAAEKMRKIEQAAQNKRINESLKAEKAKQKFEEKEIQKKQRLELKAAERSEREKASFEKKLLTQNQREESARAKVIQREKVKTEREKARVEKESIRERDRHVKTEFTRMQRAQKENQKRILAGFSSGRASTSGAGGGSGGGGAGKVTEGFWLGGNEGFNSKKFSESFAPEIVGGIAATIMKRAAFVAAAAVEAPLIPGQLMRGSLSLAQPAIDFQKGSYGISRQNRFSADRFGGYLFPGTGTTEGTETLSLLGLTPDKLMASLNAYGMGQRSPEEAARTGVMFGQQALQGGFTGLPEGTVESVARQRAGYQGTSMSGTNSYLTGIAATLEDAITKGLDRAKVLGSIEDAVEAMSKGSGGVSTQSILNMIARFQSAGTPGGRTGESAVSAMSGMSNFLKNPSGNTAGQMLAYSQMGKYGMLKSAADVKAYIGDENWNNLPPRLRGIMVRDIVGASRDGNTWAAFQIANQIGMSPNPGRISEITRPALNKNVPFYLRNSSTAIGTTMFQNYEMEAGAGAKAPGVPRAERKNFAMSPEDYRQILIGNGYSLSDANRLVREGGWKNQNPLMLANAPSRYDPNMIGTQVVEPPKSPEEMQNTVRNMMIRAQTPPGVGTAENAATQATLSGATAQLNVFVPAATFATTALEHFGDAVTRATKRVLGSYPDLPGTPGYRQDMGAGTPYVSKPPVMNMNNQ